MFELTLDCGHQAYTEIEIRYQYKSDEHYVYCPSCRHQKETVSPNKPVVLCWTKVVSTKNVSYVPSGATYVLPQDILRLQPSVPRNRIRPFPYVRGLRSDGRIKGRPAGIRNKRG